MNFFADQSAEQPADLVTVLNLVLADECLLYTKTRNYCGNVASPPFQSFHDLFEEQYDELSGIIDEIAEQVRALGGQPMGTMSEFLWHTRLEECPVGQPSLTRMIDHLLNDHRAIVHALRGDRAVCAGEFPETGTGKLLAGLVERHEKMAAALHSRLKNS